MAAGKFYFSQTTEPTDVAAGTLWYNLSKTPNVLEVYDGSDWYPAAPLKHTTTYSQSDFIDLGDGNAALRNVNFNPSSELFLNGVKLVQGQVFADLAADADFYYDTYLTPQIVMPALSADDTLDVVTLSGGYSENTQQQIDALTAVLPDMEAVIDLNLAVNQPIIEQAAATAIAQAEIATQKAIETSDPLNGWLALDNETVITRSNVYPEIKTSRPFKIDADSIQLISSNRVVKANGAPLPIASGALKLNGTMWTGTLNITATNVAADSNAPARYRLAGLPEFEDTDNYQVLATYNQEGFGFTNQTGHTVRIGKYNDHLDLFVEFDDNGTYSTASNGTVFLTIYKF